ncbi:TetR/AcrR family transcriptional regulator [Streptomonospora litoralis]|uniref:Nucleoid occlusion factor SlmA n=1 Tax=Streptomonospora litoralis TaxID=2498135 RepID=A0A4P6Q5A9_9ACTN|nr:TetR/AcrR family transcriptional regulator [Streptomonospora litoralis]QBI54064.1 Nucleoid occlusion factor SlmA [Streptomonospora litoralis]
MPSFSSAERERITSRLRVVGAELFARQGLRKTTLEDLARPAGISKAGFYSFFDSKEALFLDLMLEQAEDIGSRLAAAATGPADAREGIAALLREIATVLDTNPLYRRLLANPEELRAVRARMGDAEVDRASRALLQPLSRFIESAQREGRIVSADPGAVLGVLRAALLPVLHRDELDPDAHTDTLDLLFRTIAVGLTAPEAENPVP